MFKDLKSYILNHMKQTWGPSKTKKNIQNVSDNIR